MKTIFKSIAIYILLIICFVLFNYAAAMIPQTLVRENMTESAGYLCEDIVFPQVIDGVKATTIDRYADSITCNIAWNLGEGDTLKSIMLDEFYTSEKYNENKNFRSAVLGEETEGGEITQYMRYWHGSASVVRILHLIMSLKSIYILNAVILTSLAAFIIFRFAVKKLYDCIIGFLLGLILTSSWFVPLSLEYTWVYLVFMADMLIVMTLHDRKREDLYIYLFLASGMITCFLDFLTTETLALTMPLLLAIRLNFQNSNIKFMAKNALSWGIGYAGCWVSKWIIAAAVLRENVMPYISGHIAERLGGNIGDVPEMSLFAYIYSALMQNISVLFPAGYGTGGVFAGVAVLIVIAYFAYVYRKKEYDRAVPRSYLLIALIPYVRYIVLHNHSYIHHFFTCRAQSAVFMALILAVFHVAELPGKRSRRVAGKKRKE